MKKWIKRAVSGAFAVAILSSTSLAANFTHCADALREMQLFAGTKNGYELDRAPTRAEAAVMLVRLLGQEANAKSKNYKLPFQDVPRWAVPYIGWLYENNLTAGISQTKFGTTQLCSAQQYATFLLRTLGYADGDGYTYETALEYARTLGVIDSVNYDSKTFLRDHMVAMSYTALSRPTKAGDNMLLGTLTQQGSVNKSKAETTKLRFETSQMYTKVKEQAQANARAYQLTATVRAPSGESLMYTGKAQIAGQDLSAELRYEGQLMVGVYQKNGVRYQSINGKTAKADKGNLAELPVSAILQASEKNGTYAFSLVPDVLNKNLQGMQLKQVDYSVKTDGGKVLRQTGSIHINMPINGKTDRYIIEMQAEPAQISGEIQVPDGMQI